MTMDGITRTFKLKNDKTEEPTMYLGVNITKMTKEDGDSCWAMLSGKYCDAAVKNIEDSLKKVGRTLSTKCYTLLTSNYRLELDATSELKTDGVQQYQELVGMLRWSLELGRVDILYEVSTMSSHLLLPREGHLEQVYHMFGYLKRNNKLRLMFDCSDLNISCSRFKKYDW